MRVQSDLRPILHGLTFAVVFGVLALVVFNPALARRQPPAFTFPVTLALPGWQQVDRQDLAAITSGIKILSGQRYRFQQRSTILVLETRYVVEADGDVPAYTRYTLADPLERWEVREQVEGGFYALYLNQGQAYLSACINPQGPTTATRDQFLQNRYRYDLTPSRFGSWLMGQQEVLDRRCLWAQLNIPLGSATPQQAYRRLEEVWSSWRTEVLFP